MSTDEVQNEGNNEQPPELNISIHKDVGEINPEYRKWNWEFPQLPTEVLLLTVKNHEFLSCYYYLKNVVKSFCQGLGHVYFGEIGDDDSKEKVKVSLVRCDKGSTQAGGALVVVRNAVSYLKPKAVICVGFCGGLNMDKTKLGDVAISAKLCTYSSKKVTKYGDEQRGVKVNVSKNMGDLIRSAAHGWKAPLKDPNERKVKVHCDGVILSGPELVDFKGRQEELLEQYPEAIAIEMEGEGVYAAAFDLQIEWVVIKGVSDYADGTKKTTANWQPFASAMAASVVNNILKHPDVLEGWPHYKGVNYRDMPTGNKWSIIIGVLVLILAVALGFGLFQVSKIDQKENSVPIPGNARSGEDSLHEVLQNLAGGASGQINYKGRTIGYRAHGRVHSLQEPWVYDGTAWDIESGISVKEHHFEESEDAIKSAVSKLIEKLKTEGKISN